MDKNKDELLMDDQATNETPLENAQASETETITTDDLKSGEFSDQETVPTEEPIIEEEVNTYEEPVVEEEVTSAPTDSTETPNQTIASTPTNEVDDKKKSKLPLILGIIALLVLAGLLFSYFHKSPKEVLTAIYDENQKVTALDSDFKLKLNAKMEGTDQEFADISGNFKMNVEDLKNPMLSGILNKGSKFDGEPLPETTEIRAIGNMLYNFDGETWYAEKSEDFATEFEKQMKASLEGQSKIVDAEKLKALSTDDKVYDVQHKDGQYTVTLKEGVTKDQVIDRAFDAIKIEDLKKEAMANIEAQGVQEIGEEEKILINSTLDAVYNKEFLKKALTNVDTVQTYDDKTYALTSSKMDFQIDIKYIVTELIPKLYGPMGGMIKFEQLGLPETASAKIDLAVKSTDPAKIKIEIPKDAENLDQ